MTVGELIARLQNYGESLEVVVGVNPSETLGGIMPQAPDTVKLWTINNTPRVLIFRDPNKGA